MMDQAKVMAVGDFLKEAFPGCSVVDMEEFDRDCQFYRVDDPGGGVRHRVRVSREFFDDHTIESILARLMAWDVGGLGRAAGARAVLVSNAGAEVVGS